MLPAAGITPVRRLCIWLKRLLAHCSKPACRRVQMISRQSTPCFRYALTIKPAPRFSMERCCARTGSITSMRLVRLAPNGCDRSVRRQHNGVSRVVRYRFVEILASCGFRPGGISVTKSLFSLRVASQADGGCCKGQRESEEQRFYFHGNDRAGNSVFRQCFCF